MFCLHCCVTHHNLSILFYLTRPLLLHYSAKTDETNQGPLKTPDFHPDEKLASVEVSKTPGDVTELGVADKTIKDATRPDATQHDAMANDLNEPNPVPAETLHVAPVSELPTKCIKPGMLKDPSKDNTTADPDEDSSADGKKPKAVPAGVKTYAMVAKERKFKSALAALLAENVESGWTPVMYRESFEKISTAGVIAGNANCIAIVGNPEG